MKALITGGVRSDKTRRALGLLASLGKQRVYLASTQAYRVALCCAGLQLRMKR